MKVDLAIVSSLNGLIAKDSGDMSWISEEDNALFKKLRLESDVVIFGGNTYRTTKAKLKPTSYLRVVMTRSPQDFKDEGLPGRLEFTNEAPKALLKRLSDKDYKKALLVGGTVSNLFLQSGLVDEIHWTIEPRYFGSGHSLIDDNNFENRLELISQEVLNKQGTLYLRYKVV